MKDGVFSKKLIREDQRNKTILHDRNYLPLTVFDTVDLTKPVSDEVVLVLNTAAFSGLFTEENKYLCLCPEDRVHIKKTGDKIISDYITNGTNRIDLGVTAFYDKNIVKPLTSLPMPAKSGYVKYSLLSDQIIDREYALKTAIADLRFAHIIAIAKEALSINGIRKLFRRKAAGDIEDEE